jgi:hypothetical protein
MYHYLAVHTDDAEEYIDNTSRLLSEKMSQIAKTDPGSTYTMKQVTDLLTEIVNQLDAVSIKECLSDIDGHIDDLEEQIDTNMDDQSKCESMHTYIDFVLDHLPDSASLADREEISDALKKCECLR